MGRENEVQTNSKETADQPSNFPNHFGPDILLAGLELAMHKKDDSQQGSTAGINPENPGQVLSKIMNWLPNTTLTYIDESNPDKPHVVTPEQIKNDPFIKYVESETHENLDSLGNSESLKKTKVDGGWRVDIGAAKTNDQSDPIQMKNLLPGIDLHLGSNGSFVIEDPANNEGALKLRDIHGMKMQMDLGKEPFVFSPESMSFKREKGEDGKVKEEGDIVAINDKTGVEFSQHFTIDEQGKFNLGQKPKDPIKPGEPNK